MGKKVLKLSAVAFIMIALFIGLQTESNKVNAVTTNVNVTTFTELKTAVESASAGDVVNLSVMNNIEFTSTVLIGQSITINLSSGSGGNVNLTLASGFTGRHFQTGSTPATVTNVSNVSMTVNRGITLNGGGVGGGIAFYSSGGYFTLDGGIITNNLATSLGGGVALVGNTSIVTFTMNSGEISNNSAGNAYSQGGGIYGMNALITINGGDINNNRATAKGGGIYISLGTSNPQHPTNLIINDGIISGNITTGAGGYQPYGGGIAVDAVASGAIDEFAIHGGLITNNSTAQTNGQGGGIYYIGAPGSSFDMDGGTVSKNNSGSGGGVFINFGTFNMSGTAQISENEAIASAGGIYGYQGNTITIDGHAKIINNKANCNDDPEHALRGGGGIGLLSYGYVSTITVKGNALISGNTAVSYGGGIWTYPVYGPAPVVNIEGGTISDNLANYGGGISIGEIDQETVELSITGGTISGNTATTNGGGIITMDSTTLGTSGTHSITATNCSIINNKALNGHGGGLYLPLNTDLTITGSCHITSNHANKGNGGGIFTEDYTYFLARAGIGKMSGYTNLNISSQTTFAGNTSSAAFLPPTNAHTLYPNIGFSSVSVSNHPLNNYDINYHGNERLLFHITYEANGGTGSHRGPEVPSSTASKVLTLEETKIYRVGHKFLGWNTKADGSGTTYHSGNEITLHNNLTLYAMWQKIGDGDSDDGGSDLPDTGNTVLGISLALMMFALTITYVFRRELV